ncbi:hypothetical protein C6P40_004470, partial [Pichia californica]
MGEELKIFPNGGINNIKIGWTLYEVIQKLAENNDDDDSGIEFKFNDNLNFIIVYLREKNINLIFESFSQRLILIEIKLNYTNININKFKYKNEIINKFNFKLIYNRYFGPTCEGYYENENGFYFLSYCGISFKFNNIFESKISNEILNTMNKDLNCSSIFIYQSTSDETNNSDNETNNNNFLWMNYSKNLSNTLKIKPSIEYLNSLNKLIPSINEINNKNQIKIEYSIYNYEIKDNIEFKFFNHPLNIKFFKIKFGITTMQEIIKIFGFPQDTILKRKSRLNDIQMKKFKL